MQSVGHIERPMGRPLLVSATSASAEKPTESKREGLRDRQHSNYTIVAALGIEVTLNKHRVTTIEGVA